NRWRQQLKVAAQIGDDIVFETCNRPIVLAAHLDVSNLTAAVNRSLHILASGLDPLGRLPELHRDPSHEGFFSIHVQFRPKSTPPLRSNHPQFVLGDTDHDSELRSEQVRYLGRRPYSEFLLSGVVSGEHAAAFHRNRSEPLVNHSLFDHMVGRFQRSVDVTFTRSESISNVVAVLFITRGAPFAACSTPTTAGNSS